MIKWVKNDNILNSLWSISLFFDFTGYIKNVWDTECPILLLVLFVRNCTRYVHTIKERKVYMSILSSAYEIGITYKDNIIDSF